MRHWRISLESTIRTVQMRLAFAQPCRKSSIRALSEREVLLTSQDQACDRSNLQPESFQMNIVYANGNPKKIVSDTTWKIKAKVPFGSNNAYDREVYDARREMPGWDKVGFNASKSERPQIQEMLYP